MRSTSALSRSRVISSSAPNGSSMSSSAGCERERAGDGDALLHAARELVRVVVAEAAQLDQLEHLVDARVALCVRRTPMTSSGSRTLASTVRQSKSTGAWKTMP